MHYWSLGRGLIISANNSVGTLCCIVKLSLVLNYLIIIGSEIFGKGKFGSFRPNISKINKSLNLSVHWNEALTDALFECCSKEILHKPVGCLFAHWAQCLVQIKTVFHWINSFPRKFFFYCSWSKHFYDHFTVSVIWPIQDFQSWNIS